MNERRCTYEVEPDDAHPWPGGGFLCGKPAIKTFLVVGERPQHRCDEHAGRKP